jgi:hypothetical protein
MASRIARSSFTSTTATSTAAEAATSASAVRELVLFSDSCHHRRCRCVRSGCDFALSGSIATVEHTSQSLIFFFRCFKLCSATRFSAFCGFRCFSDGGCCRRRNIACFGAKHLAAGSDGLTSCRRRAATCATANDKASAHVAGELI